MPSGSCHLTGFLHEKPLSRLRATMATRGIGRAETAREPEDHAGTMMKVVAGLIPGAHGNPAELATQRQVRQARVAPWAGRFFGDLETAENARLYRPVGRIGRLLLEIEADAFEMT